MHVLKVCIYGFVGLILVLSCALIGHLKAESPSLIISEVKVRNDPSGLDEYIELYNPGTTAVSLNDYFIGYANAAQPDAEHVFNRSVIAQGVLGVNHYYLLAKNQADPHLTNAQQSPFSSLSDSGGTLQITDQTGVVLDEMHWTGTASAASNNVIYMPGTTAARSQSIKRARTSDGTYFITPASWQVASPDPQGSPLAQLLPGLTDSSEQEDPSPDQPSEASAEEPSQPPLPSMESSEIEITELLPNPAAPATDETEEYIELHNLSAAALNLKDYKLQSGTSFTYSYTFPDHLIQPDEYEAFKVSETHLLLSNAGGHSRLLNPTGEVISQTDSYGAAAPGRAWALIDDIWQWTDMVTPGAANVASVMPVTTKSAKASKQPAAKSAARTPKTTKITPKSKIAPTAKARPSSKVKSSAKKKPSSNNTKNNVNPTKNTPSIHPLMLAGVGLSTVLYGLYEYRQDIGPALRRLRGNRGVRRAIGSQAQGSGSD
jgi:hypothetical protein